MAVDSKIKLRLSKHYVNIDSPIPFYIICNPQGSENDFLQGSDIQYKHPNSWTFDCFALISQFLDKWSLDEKGGLVLQKNPNSDNPIMTMELQYDSNLLAEGQKIEVTYFDVYLESVAGVAGQLVNFDQSDILHNFDLVKQKLDNLQLTVDDFSNYVRNKVFFTYVSVDTLGNVVEERYNRNRERLSVRSEQFWEYWYDFPAACAMYCWGKLSDDSNFEFSSETLFQVHIMPDSSHYLCAVDYKDNDCWHTINNVKNIEFRIYAKN